MQPPRQTPDRMLRESLRTKENLRDFLESALPEQIANFDFEQFEEIPREVFSGDWHEREADLIFEIGYRIEGESARAIVGVLVEHQSDTETAVPLRALFMLTAFWERRWRQWERLASPRPPFRLPPVFSVVLYTADTVWGSNTNVRQLLGEPAALHPFAPDWGPVFWNLAERTPEALLAGGAWMQLMAVMRVTNEERAEYERVLTEACRRLAPLSEGSHVRWSRLIHAILTYVLFRRPAAEHTRLREVIEQQTPAKAEEVRAMEKTMVQVWEEQGEIRNARATLRDLVVDRFGSVPEHLSQRIEAATDLTRLRSAVRQVYKVDSIDELTL